MCPRRVEDHYSSGVRSLLDAVSWDDIDVRFVVLIAAVECTETAPRMQRCEVASVKRIRHSTSRRNHYIILWVWTLSPAAKIVFENSVCERFNVKRRCDRNTANVHSEESYNWYCSILSNLLHEVNHSPPYVDHFSPYGAEVRNEWNYSSFPHKLLLYGA